MNQFIKKMQKIAGRHITDSRDMVNIYETREMGTMSSRDMETVKNQKIPTIRDFLKWTRGGLHPFHQVLTLICYFIHHGPGSTSLLYKMVTEISKQKEPLLQEALFVAPDNVRNVQTISVYNNYTPIHKSVKWVCG